MTGSPNETDFINEDFDVKNISDIFFYCHTTGKKWSYFPPLEDVYTITFQTNGSSNSYHNSYHVVTEKNKIYIIDRTLPFHADGITNEFDYYGINLCFEKKLNTKIFPIEFTPRDPAYYLKQFRAILEVHEKKGYGYKIKEKLIATKILYQMLLEIAEQTHSYSKHRVINNSISYLEHNMFSPELSIEEIASKSGITSSHFRMIFKEIYNISPIKYITKKRMEKAVEFLSYDNNIMEIATMVGYNSSIHFNRVFKAYYGISPLKYKQNYL